MRGAYSVSDWLLLSPGPDLLLEVAERSKVQRGSWTVKHAILTRISSGVKKRRPLSQSTLLAGGSAGDSKPPASFSCLFPFFLFLFRSINHCWVIGPYFSRFPPFQNSQLLPFPFPPTISFPHPTFPSSHPCLAPLLGLQCTSLVSNLLEAVPGISASHPLNGILIDWVAWWI